MDRKLNTHLIDDKMEQRGLSQSALAEMLNVSRESVSQWLQNAKFPRPDKLLRIAEILDLQYSEIVIKRSANEPVIAFRKKGNTKTTGEHIARAIDMGKMLGNIVPCLPYERLSKPSTLLEPRNEYSYIQKAAEEVRRAIGMTDSIIKFNDLINFFSELHAVIIPVLWGKKDYHENSLHIYLPDSMTTWVYLNLDTNILDFKFWMSHELGHVKAPDLEGEDAEEFADSFAGALLYPEKFASVDYKRISRPDNDNNKIAIMINRAEELLISPITIFQELNHYAKYVNEPGLTLPLLYPATSRLNKNFSLMSEVILNTKNKPRPEHYVKETEQTFKTPFFKCLGKYLLDNKKDDSYIQRIMNIPATDAKGIFHFLRDDAKQNPRNRISRHPEWI
jgi:transcriptional regulator with XRE-family HTH domain